MSDDDTLSIYSTFTDRHRDDIPPTKKYKHLSPQSAHYFISMV
jgi:hypothetical protein